jgi:hypothetical protein
MKKIAIALIIVLTVFSSCSKDDDNGINLSSRSIRYELTGNFTGNNIITAYTTASGGTITEQITSLPWTKEITFDAGVSGSNITISGAGGMEGQQATLIVKKGGNPVGSPTTATVDARGIFTIVGPVVVF